jgi:hypothetical protein
LRFLVDAQLPSALAQFQRVSVGLTDPRGGYSRGPEDGYDDLAVKFAETSAARIAKTCSTHTRSSCHAQALKGGK